MYFFLYRMIKMGCIIPFYNYCKYRKKRKCNHCQSIISNDTNYGFCDKKCEILYVYKDSFKSLDSSLHKYLINIDL
jgi:hypothetical protein